MRPEVNAEIAFRVAKVLDASIYDVIAGRALPDGTCRGCDKEPSEHWRCESGDAATMRRRPAVQHQVIEIDRVLGGARTRSLPVREPIPL